MSIKQNGGVFGRNPTFNDVTIEGQLTFDGDIDINSDLKIDGDLEVIRDIRSLVISARFQLTSGNFVFTDIEEQQGLHRVDVQKAKPFEFVFDHIK